MYVILVYDVNVNRVNKVLKVARKYLHWVQNSVLEGELTEARYRKLKAELLAIINEKEDSLLFYTFNTRKYTSREAIGVKKGGEEWIL
ncbi:CRISPR associated protein Cas2 [Moorella glycerini]|uniref:CRISPR-associated endoribonuclease Cas2 n=1 Tax=Neomoorella stamsii TaxID=1266720 RepID=A0A9X7P4U2_9FIRM|nr:CRISPR-associated endonuclease Cas2 [Moorella stamsii]PRR69352.1 CRISPR-associated endoribonuclease Cas2 [Moorella stamsii]CEP66644.1 CRISPR associated protein Cas2 [Moorella glycerini]